MLMRMLLTFTFFKNCAMTPLPTLLYCGCATRPTLQKLQLVFLPRAWEWLGHVVQSEGESRAARLQEDVVTRAQQQAVAALEQSVRVKFV